MSIYQKALNLLYSECENTLESVPGTNQYIRVKFLAQGNNGSLWCGSNSIMTLWLQVKRTTHCVTQSPLYRNHPVHLSVHISCNSSWMDEPILIKCATVSRYELLILMKCDTVSGYELLILMKCATVSGYELLILMKYDTVSGYELKIIPVWTVLSENISIEW